MEREARGALELLLLLLPGRRALERVSSMQLLRWRLLLAREGAERREGRERRERM